MPEHVIEARGLGKEYRIGAVRSRRGRSVRDSVSEAAAAARRRLRTVVTTRTWPAAAPRVSVWALRDASFTVGQGEVLGIVGHNGAGKSTLLKILTRITSPTAGWADLHGRVGSLLEVGTGFHPELTGRDNVYLNGAILGMSRAHIDRRFDEIVDFSGVGKFIDTPVKRYSSGMHVRLAFAVAAHLDPEILIVDEVLAVGDVEFQRRCLGRMDEIARSGRTVLFVSHNVHAVRRLCTRALLVQGGRLAYDGSPDEVIRRHLAAGSDYAVPGSWIDLGAARRTGSGQARFARVRFDSGSTALDGWAYTGGPLRFDMEITAEAEGQAALAVHISDQHGTKLVNADSEAIARQVLLPGGASVWRLTLERLHLKAGVYVVGVWLGNTAGQRLDAIEEAFRIDVLPRGDGRIGARVHPRYDGVVACDFDVAPIGRDPDATVAGRRAARA